MSKPTEFMKKYGVDDDEIWEVRKGTYAIKHVALERIAAAEGITFDLPKALECNPLERTAHILVSGKLGDRVEWSTGEAAPSNCKPPYPLAMAEKRAKDRVVLKLLNAHGAVYSEAEADEFAQAQPALPKKDAKEVYSRLQTEIRDCQSLEILEDWKEANMERIDVLPPDWRETLSTQYREHRAALKGKK